MVARSPLRDSTLPSSTLEAPVKLATKESAGRFIDLGRRRICSSLPSRITPMRSPSTTASDWSLRDIEPGHAGLLQDAAQFVAQPDAQLGVEVAERLRRAG